MVVWLTDPFEVVALSSRAFALFDGPQCALALNVSVKDGKGTPAQRIGFVAIGLVCIVAAIARAPAGSDPHRLVRNDADLEPGLVMKRETVDQVGAGAIVADDLNLSSVTP